MKKTPLLNSALSQLIADFGHGDMVVIADACLPIPAHTQRIDLALTKNIPGFINTLGVILTEMQVENAFVAQEMASVNPVIKEEISALLPDIVVSQVSHEEFKKMSAEARAIVRTGEFTPYANIILIAGAVF